MRKRVCALLLSICIAFGILLQFPVTARAAAIVDSGTWGGIDWVLSEDGTLTISPTTNEITLKKIKSEELYQVGEWPAPIKHDASATTKRPYESYAADVKYLVIKEGVTSIGSFTAKFPNLTGEVVIPSTVTYIGQEAFQKSPMTKLTFAPGGTEELCIAAGAFKVLAVKEVFLPADRPSIHLHSWTFQDCADLEKVYIPDNVEYKPHNHLDYSSSTYSNDINVLAYCYKLNTVVFESPEAETRFSSVSSNTKYNAKVYHHACQEGNWIQDEKGHCKRECRFSDCPMGRNVSTFDWNLHTFGADNFCTVCGYQPEGGEAPETGDTTHLLLWTGLFACGAVMTWMQMQARKREMY